MDILVMGCCIVDKKDIPESMLSMDYKDKFALD